MCQTAARTAGTGERALIWASSECVLPASTPMRLTTVFSTNGGTTYTFTGVRLSIQQNGGTAGMWQTVEHFDTVNLTAGTSYRFAAQVDRFAGTDGSSCSCRILVMTVKI